MITDTEFMRHALDLARKAQALGEVPVGALVVLGDRVIGEGFNQPITLKDPTAHAEVLALREASAQVGSWRLAGCAIYVTLEPCAMCAGAIVLARVPRVVYGAPDPKAGMAGSVLDVLGEPRLNHRPKVAPGLLADESAELLRSFFASRR